MLRRTIRTIAGVSTVAVIAACSNANAERAADLAARTRTLTTGATLRAVAVTDVTSHRDHAGAPFIARTVNASLNAAGDTVIPVGAELLGTVTALESAGTPGSTGTLRVAFTNVRFGGERYPIATRVVSLGTRTVARGITVEDAAKVGVGAAAGAVAGRVIGGNRTGAAVGAAGGAAAGAVYANRTKDHDIVLSPGSRVEVVLTTPFRMKATL